MRPPVSMHIYPNLDEETILCYSSAAILGAPIPAETTSEAAGDVQIQRIWLAACFSPAQTKFALVAAHSIDGTERRGD